MEYKKINETYFIKINKDEEVITSLTKLCEEENIKLASISGIGAAKEVQIGLYDVLNKEYHSKVFNGMFEITSLLGTLTEKDNKPYFHLHINFADETYQTLGGHLNKCVIGATCEIILIKSEGKVERKFDEEIGLNVFSLN